MLFRAIWRYILYHSKRICWGLSNCQVLLWGGFFNFTFWIEKNHFEHVSQVVCFACNWILNFSNGKSGQKQNPNIWLDTPCNKSITYYTIRLKLSSLWSLFIYEHITKMTSKVESYAYELFIYNLHKIQNSSSFKKFTRLLCGNANKK